MSEAGGKLMSHHKILEAKQLDLLAALEDVDSCVDLTQAGSILVQDPSRDSIVNHSSIPAAERISVPEQVKAKRLRLHMSQKEFADALGMPRYGERTIRRWESGETSPSALELKALLSFPEHVPFPNPPAGTAPFRMIDLFAGIGGTRLGFWQTGKVEVVFSSEINAFAVKTYEANYGDTPVGDITKVVAASIPDHDILVGGFPCQAFSQAGLKKGFEDTRGTLFFDIVRILKVKRPRAFLLENVRNLVGHDHGKTFAVITETLFSLGYELYYKVLSSKDYGVPQNRQRIYIVGFAREQVPAASCFAFPAPTSSSDLKLGSILEQEVDPKYTISDRLWQGHQRRRINNAAAGKGFGYSLFTRESPYANTISARYYKDGSEILIYQGETKNPRKLTPREAARLQGFPEDFVIPVSDTQAYRQFGNSVSVPVINAIARQMLKVLES